MNNSTPFLDQSITLLSPNGPIVIPIPSIDAFNDESISVTLNYGFQLGACFLLLLVTLLVTKPHKILRPSSLLHLAGLSACLIRTAINQAFFHSPLNHFYPFWSGDYTSVPLSYMRTSVAGTCASLLLVIILEAALMHQAWTMVSLWPPSVKIPLVTLSALVSLLTVGWRFAFTVIQSNAVMGLAPARNLAWVVNGALVLNCLSICWYCALFNVKLALHLFVNRGILRSASVTVRKALTPMEILVMTNGVLMIVPVIFAGLEWAHFPNFESASLTHTSVALILPLGTLVAQQVSQASGNNNLSYLSTTTPAHSHHTRASNTTREKPPHHDLSHSMSMPCHIASVSTTCGSGSGSGSGSPTRLLSSSSLFKRGPNSTMGKSMSMDRSSDSCKGAQRLDHFDLELRRIDSSGGGDGLVDHHDHDHDHDHDHGHGHHVRVDMHVAQEETRI
ncbi:hypothetical protein E4U17_004411 [Claviceps sp. LM77 group G4]|nr:hypothetical protein E4U17_004411 [Claviceps sp. LM77 group G4]KAG6069996.1 hypothetical protein E4U33_004469 [Claviceps sp. LM78 group G4]KAG6074386.1 hypothetical protein E4U16_003991 [Claviceps sp. LM84 group G4]